MLQSPSRGNEIELLLQAAEYLESQDKQRKEKEHGYAADIHMYRDVPLQTKMKPIRRSQNRTSHNELEKNRRAHLRTCLETLKAIVPLNQDVTRHTTLGLLNQASSLIKILEEKKQRFNQEKAELQKYNTYLKEAVLKLEISRQRRNSTGSAWSSGYSESSNDSDKDEEIIDVTNCAEEAQDSLRAGLRLRSSNLITISVPKALSLPLRAGTQQARHNKSSSAC